MTYLTPKEDNTVKKSLLPRKKKKNLLNQGPLTLSRQKHSCCERREMKSYGGQYSITLWLTHYFFSNLPYLLLYHISHILSINWYTTIKPFSISKGIFFLKPWGNIQFLPSTLSISILQAKRGLEVYNESSSGKGLMSLQEEKELLKTTIKLNLWRCIHFSLSKH